MRTILARAICLALIGRAVTHDIPKRTIRLRQKLLYEPCRNPISPILPGPSGDLQYCADLEDAVFLQGPFMRFPNATKTCNGVSEPEWGQYVSNKTNYQPTAFKERAERYGLYDLDPKTIPYVSLGHVRDDYPFKPENYGIRPYSAVAVLCRDQVFWGIWGDRNRGNVSVGLSAVLADQCFPTGDTAGLRCNDTWQGNSYDDQVPTKSALVIAFPGSYGVVRGLDWSSTEAFQDSIRSTGEFALQMAKDRYPVPNNINKEIDSGPGWLERRVCGLAKGHWNMQKETSNKIWEGQYEIGVGQYHTMCEWAAGLENKSSA